MHNKISEQIDINDEHRGMRKSKSTSNLSISSKKKFNHVEPDESNNKPSPLNRNTSPNQRRRVKRSSINNNSLLTTISTVHEFMSFIIHKDNPPVWLKQTDVYREFEMKSNEINRENPLDEIVPQYYQQLHRKQSSNLHLYARSSQSWQTTIEDQSTETKLNPNHSPPIENQSVKSKSPSKPLLTRRQHMLCRKKLPENNYKRRQRMNSVENREPSEKKDSSATSDSNASSSSIEHTSPSPTTTVSASSSYQSSPRDCMRANTSISTPLRIQTSISPTNQTSATTPQRRSTRIWAPSNFFIDPVWVTPNSTSPTSTSSTKRLLVQNSDESSKRPRRRCRS